MLRKQVFKTYEGVMKRVRFENAHSKQFRFRAVKMDDGTYRIEKKWVATEWSGNK